MKPSPDVTNWKSVAVDNNGKVWASGDYSYERLIPLAPALPTFGDERAHWSPRHRQDADRAGSNSISLSYECGQTYLCGPDGVLYKLSPVTGATIKFLHSKSTIYDIGADRFGNVHSAEYDPQFGANISKYRNDMHKRWAKYTTDLNGPIASGFLPRAVATDYEGNVYTLGSANLGKYSTTYTLRKYTPHGTSSGQAGIMLWSKDLSRITNSGWPGRLAVFPGHQGVIFVGYDTRETGPVPPILPTLHLASYTKAGVERWTRATQRYVQPFFLDAAPNGRLLTVGTQTLLRSGFTYLDLPLSKYAK